MELGLQGRRALITGASKGIGLATADVLAEEGCDLVLAARSTDLLAEAARRLRALHGVDVTCVTADLRQSSDLDRLVDAAGEIDVLVNNAGDIPAGSLAVIDEAKWRHAWELKVFGYIDLTRLVYAAMRERGGGVIINVIGVGGERFDAEYIVGASGNAALMAFTRALGGRSLDDGIRVVGINPGAVATERSVTLMRARAETRLGDPDRYLELTAGLPGGRQATPREIGSTVAFLASERSAYTTGVIVTVDGGASSRPS